MSAPPDQTLRGRLAARSYAELLEASLFWLEAGVASPPPGAIVEPLARAMLDPDRISNRLRLLSAKAKTVLGAVLCASEGALQSTQWASTGLRGYEVESAAGELVRRAFLFAERRHGAVTYRVAADARPALAEALSQDGRPIDSVFSREGFFRHRGGGVLPQGRLADRIESARRSAGDIVPEVISRFGGLLTRSSHARLEGASEFDRARLRAALEENGLGTALRLSLEEYGIALRGDTVVAFHETLEEALLEGTPAAGGGEPPPSIACAGVDGLNDLTALVGRLHASGARLTLASRLTKPSRRALLEEMTTRDEKGAGEFLEFLLRFARSADLVAPGKGQRLVPSSGASAFEALSLREKLRKLVAYALHERADSDVDFHMKALRPALLEIAAALPPAAFVPAALLNAAARNRTFARLDRQKARERYQELFQHGHAPRPSDPLALAYAAHRFVAGRLHPLGLVDLAYRGTRVEAVRLTALGAEVLTGAEPGDGGGPSRALIVNPDFEVVVFPEATSPELLYSLSRFARRTKADLVSTYRLTRESVAQAAASGMSAEEIVETLARHARAPLPESVAVALRDWSFGGRLLTTSGGAPLLEAGDKGTLDTLLLRVPGLESLVVRKVSETAAELRPGPLPEAIAAELGRRGVRIE